VFCSNNFPRLRHTYRRSCVHPHQSDVHPSTPEWCSPISTFLPPWRACEAFRGQRLACICIFYVFNNEHFYCAFFFDFWCFCFIFCVHFLHFLPPPIVKVDISDIAIRSVIPDMVKAIISGITNTPQKTYRFFFCIHFLHFLLPPIVKVDISDIAIRSVIPDMVKTIISGITNTPQETYRIAQ
jgi:hypothetical protein